VRIFTVFALDVTAFALGFTVAERLIKKRLRFFDAQQYALRAYCCARGQGDSPLASCLCICTDTACRNMNGLPWGVCFSGF